MYSILDSFGYVLTVLFLQLPAASVATIVIGLLLAARVSAAALVLALGIAAVAIGVGGYILSFFTFAWFGVFAPVFDAAVLSMVFGGAVIAATAGRLVLRRLRLA